MKETSNKIIYLGSDIGFNAMLKELRDRAVAENIETKQESVEKALIDADALLDASMKVRITNNMVKKARKLKIIACATTGSDHIELDELKKRSIPVRTLREDRSLLLNLTPAAEHSWALLMACARKLFVAIQHVNSGKWIRELFPGIMLKGKKIGIIGCGRIGTWMGRYARAFGMDVLGYDPYVDPLPEGFKKVELETLLRNCDFITIHVHLSEETKGLISKKQFEIIKPGAVLINTSRGAVINEIALLESLKKGQIKAAGLDVLDGEPNIEQHPLVQYAKTNDNLIITPHCAGFSPDAVSLVCRHSTKKILQMLGFG